MTVVHKTSKYGPILAEIEHEHLELKQRLARLRELAPCLPGEEDCGRCSEEVRAECWERLTDFFAELIEYMRAHFQREDAVMRSIDDALVVKAAFAAHVEAHADMMERVTRLIAEPTLTRERLAAWTFIEDWLKDHIVNHDAALLRRLRAESR